MNIPILQYYMYVVYYLIVNYIKIKQNEAMYSIFKGQYTETRT